MPCDVMLISPDHPGGDGRVLIGEAVAGAIVDHGPCPAF